MKIVFLAGCLNRQKNLRLKEHYYSLLIRQLMANGHAAPDIQLESYQSYFKLGDTVRDVLQYPFEVLVLFIRPFPLHAMVKPVIRYRDKTNKSKLVMHEAISGMNFRTEALDEFADARINGVSKRSIIHRIAGGINNSFGKMLGLDTWAVNHICKEISSISALCRDRNIKLIVAGPPMYPAHGHIDNLCALINQNLVDVCRTQDIAHIDLLKTLSYEGKAILNEDGIHLSPAGHGFVAQSIFNLLP